MTFPFQWKYIHLLMIVSQSQGCCLGNALRPFYDYEMYILGILWYAQSEETELVYQFLQIHGEAVTKIIVHPN